ncbi:hypothetical protein CARUB_v10007429mg, partial [Capsella rubella]
VPSDSRRRKKTSPELSGLSLLPDEIALRCLARVSRVDHAALSLVSKSHHSLLASPELFYLRWEMGCTNAYLYVCMRVFPNRTPSWFILSPNRRLKPIPSNPYQPPHSSSFVVVESGIYVIGGLTKDRIRTSDVSFLDCYSHTWHRFKSMNMPRASALASSVDGKIYVFGGSKNYDTSAEVFDPKTQTWTPHFRSNQSWDIDTPHNNDIPDHVVMVIERKQDSPLYEEYGSFYFLASDEIGSKTDWCIIEKQVYYRSTRGKILWCELDELRDWKEVKAGNIVIFWISESLDLWSAEIYVERREGGETWGKIKWSNVVFKVDPFSNPSYGVKILYCASVFV